MSRLYLKGGANEVTLKSGDQGFYVDICIEHLLEMIEQNPDLKRVWVSQRENKAYNNVRIFISPTKFDTEEKKYTHYLELAESRVAVEASDWQD